MTYQTDFWEFPQQVLSDIGFVAYRVGKPNVRWPWGGGGGGGGERANIFVMWKEEKGEEKT